MIIKCVSLFSRILGVQGEGTEIFLWDEAGEKETLEGLRELAAASVVIVKTEVVFAMLEKKDVTLDDYVVTLGDPMEEDITEIPVLESQDIDDPMEGNVVQKPGTSGIEEVEGNVVQKPGASGIEEVEGNVVQKPGTSGIAEVEGSLSTNKRKLSSSSDGDDFPGAARMADRFAVHVIETLLHSSLHLEIGRLATMQIRMHPSYSEDPVNVRLTFKGDIKKMNMGVVNDFAKYPVIDDDAPLVGGLFYDVLPEQIQGWGLKLFGKNN